LHTKYELPDISDNVIGRIDRSLWTTTQVLGELLYAYD
jgi:hypothetical protein